MKILFLVLFILGSLGGLSISELDKPTGEIMRNGIIEITDAPYLVSIMFKRKTEEYTFQCAGALISMSHVVTAAHCVVSKSNAMVRAHNVRIYAGINSLSDRFITFSETRWIKVHPQYRSYRIILWNDIGILKSSDPFLFTKSVKPIALRHLPVSEGTLCQVVGWGTSSSEAVPSKHLMSETVPIFGKYLCSVNYASFTGYPLHPGTICAGYEKVGQSSCQGDSGGPLVCDGLLTGISSFNKECGKNAGFPVIYTDISQYVDWIASPQKCDASTPTSDFYFPLILVTIIYCLML